MKRQCLAWLAVGAMLGGCGEQQAQGALAEPQVALKAVAGTRSAVEGVRVDLRPGWNAVGFQATTLTALDSTATGLAFFNGTGYTTGSVNAATVNEGEGGRRGFWVFANAAGSLTYSGTGGPDFVQLAAGWNLVSFATSAELPGTRLSAQQNGASVPLNQAVLTTFSEIQPDGTYRSVDVTGGGVLQPGRAAWVFAAAPTRLLVSQPPSPSPSPGSTSSPAPPGSSLALTPAHPTIQVFSYVQLNVSGASGPLEWSSSVPSVAAVDAQGLVRGLNKGQATVTVRSAGQAAETTVTVTDVAPPPGGGNPSPTPALFVPSVISRQNGLQGAPAGVTDNAASPNYIPRQLSDDGRYAVFLSNEPTLPGGGTFATQAYRRDLTTGATELASSHNGNIGSTVLEATISPDGRYVAFSAFCGGTPNNDYGPSGSSGPFTGGATTRSYVYLRDMNGPTLRLVSCAAGQPTVRANQASSPFTADQPAVSNNGAFVAYRYRGTAPNAVTGPTAPVVTPDRFHVYRADMTGGTPMARVLSVAPTGATGVVEGNANSDQPSISSDGRYVAYHSLATNLIPSSSGLGDDVFRADGTAVQADVQLASRPFGSVAPSGASGAQDFPSLSADGRYVALRTNDQGVYQAGTGAVNRQTVRVDLGSGLPRPVIHASASSGGAAADAACNAPFLAGNGGYVAFTSAATNLGTPNNGFIQLIRRNLGGTACTLASGLSGTPANEDVQHGSLSADGQQATFYTRATNLGLNSPPFLYFYHVLLGP